MSATLRNGDGKPIEDQRAEAATAFLDRGVTQKQLETRLGKPFAQWTPAHLAELRRIYTTITVDGISIDAFFPEQAVAVPETGETA